MWIYKILHIIYINVSNTFNSLFETYCCNILTYYLIILKPLYTLSIILTANQLRNMREAEISNTS